MHLTADSQFIELMAAKAFPASIVQPINGWLARYTPDVRSRRANSILPLTFSPGRPTGETGHEATVAGAFAATLSESICFYETRGLPARVQISPAAVPFDLDERLERAGFVRESTTLAMVCPLAAPLARLAPWDAGLHVEIRPQPSAEWLSFYLEHGTGKAMTQSSAAELLFRIHGEAAFLTVRAPEQVVGIGLGVLDDWHGVFSVATHPGFTRRGVASCIVRGLAERGTLKGKEFAYLQVAEENYPARALYEKAGFETAYSYHYRSGPDPEG